jgi:hypothetical protein
MRDTDGRNLLYPYYSLPFEGALRRPFLKVRKSMTAWGSQRSATLMSPLEASKYIDQYYGSELLSLFEEVSETDSVLLFIDFDLKKPATELSIATGWRLLQEDVLKPINLTLSQEFPELSGLTLDDIAISSGCRKYTDGLVRVCSASYLSS